MNTIAAILLPLSGLVIGLLVGHVIGYARGNDAGWVAGRAWERRAMLDTAAARMRELAR